MTVGFHALARAAPALGTQELGNTTGTGQMWVTRSTAAHSAAACGRRSSRSGAAVSSAAERLDGLSCGRGVLGLTRTGVCRGGDVLSCWQRARSARRMAPLSFCLPFSRDVRLVPQQSPSTAGTSRLQASPRTSRQGMRTARWTSSSMTSQCGKTARVSMTPGGAGKDNSRKTTGHLRRLSRQQRH